MSTDIRELKRRKRIGRVINATTSSFNSWFSYISVVLTAVFFAFFYLQDFFRLIVILLICLPVFSYILTRYAFERLEPSLKFSAPSCAKNSCQDLELRIINRSGIPVSCAEITLNTTSLFYGGEPAVTHSLQLKPGEDNLLSFPMTFNKYGIYKASSDRLKVFDYLHLFSFEKTLFLEASVSVMPDTEPSDRLSEALYAEGFDEFTDNDRRGSVSSNVTDIREYRPGDRLSRIHWKLTEKLDKLIVKENEATSSNEFIVLLELYQPSKEECELTYEESGNTDDSKYYVLDDAIEEAWSVSKELLNAGETFMFMFYHEAADDFTGRLIRSEDELAEIFTQAFYTGSYSTPDLALSVYERAGLNKGTLIHIN